MPFIKLRRLRRNSQVRELFSQVRLSVEDLIMPYFIIEGKDKKEAVKAMPGVYRLSIDNLLEDIKEARNLGIKAILLFGVCRNKDDNATTAYSKSGIVQRAIKEIKKDIKGMAVITDVCLCGYTSHGHCGIIKAKSAKRRAQSEFIIDNDETIKILAKIALSHAQAGADFVAPSAMMDGQVKMIRETLDKNGFGDTGILAYSAKYASSFYGPFREALGSHPQFQDRKSYQMDYRNPDEALREVREDITEGADIIMVKPALAYLDIIYRVKENFNIPIAAYNVSGEYALIRTSCQNKEDEKQLALEILTSIKRAGADLIITYYAKEAARWLKA